MSAGFVIFLIATAICLAGWYAIDRLLRNLDKNPD